MTTAQKTTFKEDLPTRMREKAGKATSPEKAVEEVTAILFEDRDDIYWVGTYAAEGGAAVRKTMHGPLPPAHSYRIGPGSNVGLCIYEEAAKLSKDVSEDDDYAASFVAVASKLVVPVRHNGAVIGALDCQSTETDAFSEEDRKIVETAAEIIGPFLARLVPSDDA